MTIQDAQIIARALDGLGHAVRRSTAAQVGLSLTPPDGTDQAWQANAEKVLTWINGKAGAENLAQRVQQTSPLGEPWPPPE